MNDHATIYYYGIGSGSPHADRHHDFSQEGEYVIRTSNIPEIAKSGGPIAHSYVDEAGDPILFSSKGEVLIGTNGCSRFFMLGKLDVVNPSALSANLTKLRQALLADPYFTGVPSFNPACRKTACQFHAKDDLPEVRHKVFSLLGFRRWK